MAVRAKFKLHSYETSLHYSDPKKELRTLKFSPVTGGSDENQRFFAWTPGGQLQLGLLNPEAWTQFELGKEYYLDFTVAE